MHQELRFIWLKDPARFAVLSAAAQWALHSYFVLEHSVSDDQILAYRREVPRVDPSLPQRGQQGDHEIACEGSTPGGVSRATARSAAETTQRKSSRSSIRGSIRNRSRAP